MTTFVAQLRQPRSPERLVKSGGIFYLAISERTAMEPRAVLKWYPQLGWDGVFRTIVYLLICIMTQCLLQLVSHESARLWDEWGESIVS